MIIFDIGNIGKLVTSKCEKMFAKKQHQKDYLIFISK